MAQCKRSVSCLTPTPWIRTRLSVRDPNLPTSLPSLSAISFPNTNGPIPIESKRGLEGTVIAVTGESVYLDIGFKTEGIMPLADFQAAGETVKPGDKMPVSPAPPYQRG